MEDRQFDLIARAQGTAGSRRQGLKLLVGSLLGGLLTRVGVSDAAAACRTFNKKCDNKRRCCNGIGIRCRDARCKCRNGHARCTAGPGCQNLKRDPDHCGKCGKKCPVNKPCCIKGECRPKCGDVCCPDCFLTVTADGLDPDPDSAQCCKDVNGKVCSKKPGTGDDRCCYDNEKCLKGRCCDDQERYGETRCAGTCCRQAACCNGTKCCKQGQVCATKTEGAQESCVSANRSCAGDDDCFPGEVCVGNKCCSDPRICKVEGTDTPVCCGAGKYCEFVGQGNEHCVPVHTSDSTYRSYRVRP